MGENVIDWQMSINQIQINFKHFAPQKKIFIQKKIINKPNCYLSKIKQSHSFELTDRIHMHTKWGLISFLNIEKSV